MPGFKGTKEEAQIAKLLREKEIAKLQKNKDRWNLPPIEKGWVRGMVIKLRPHDEPCPYGTLQVLEFEVADGPKVPGIPVRMTGTYFNSRLIEGQILDVPDPTPSVRPITPDIVYRSHSARESELRAFYPGRGEKPRRFSLMLGLLGLGVPAVALIVAIIALHVFHIVD